MRVTQNQITRQYMNSSNSSLANMNEIYNKVLTQRKFTRAYEDPVGAVHALRIRNSLDDIDIYSNNLSSAEGILDSAESALLNISSITTSITDAIIRGVNGTKDLSQKQIEANGIRKLAEEMIAQVNIDYGGRHIFGGTNNSSPAFELDEVTGELTYNGVNISENDITLYNENGPIPVDIGLGIKFDASGKVDEQTVLDISLSGAEYLGYGTDADGDSQNLIRLALDAADALDKGDDETAQRLLDKINTAKSSVSIGITNIGFKQKTVELSQNRIETNQINLYEAQNNVEGADVAEEITNLKVAQMAYNASLSMGSYIIPNSIFDFMR